MSYFFQRYPDIFFNFDAKPPFAAELAAPKRAVVDCWTRNLSLFCSCKANCGVKRKDAAKTTGTKTYQCTDEKQ